MSESLVIHVDGMGCQSCVSAVQKAVAGVAPDAAVTVDLPTGEVRITNSPVPLAALSAAIEAAGYDIKR